MSDLISRQAAINEIERAKVRIYHSIERAIGRSIIEILDEVEKDVRGLPPAEPKRETATVSVGMSKGGVTMWYECEACGEPVDQGDTFCSGCGRRLIHENN